MDKDHKKKIEQQALAGATAETVKRFGSAIKEHLVAFSGKDRDAIRSLKSISESKVSKEYKKTNIKQQAGFSAEVKSVTKDNADKIIMGEKKRVSRTDDNDVPIEIPKDFYDIVQADYAERISKLDKQIQNAEAKGDKELVAKLQKQKDKVETTRNNLRKSNVSNKEAVFARKHPGLSTAKDVVKVAHKAGVQQAKVGAAMSGSISIIKNFVACVKGEIEPKDAAIEVAKDTGKGAAFSYATAFSGAVVKGAMQNASSGYIRTLSKTSLPTQMVSTTINVGKVMKKYLVGEITGAQCIEQLGEDGFGELGAAMYSTIAVAAVQGVGNTALTIVAGAAGASVGYMAAVAVYQELATSLKEYELAKEERKRIEAECAEAVILIRGYREDMIASYEKYFTEHLTDFKNGMDAMDQAITEGDVDGFLASNAQIQSALGHTIQFTSQQEFDVLMLSDEDFKL